MVQRHADAVRAIFEMNGQIVGGKPLKCSWGRHQSNRGVHQICAAQLACFRSCRYMHMWHAYLAWYATGRATWDVGGHCAFSGHHADSMDVRHMYMQNLPPFETACIHLMLEAGCCSASPE